MSIRVVPVFFLLCAVMCVSTTSPSADACCAVFRSGEPVVNADQTVIILWDAAAKTQHFIRQASFKGEAADFGFLVPSPTQPELSEAGDEAFPYLRKLTEPETRKAPRSLGVGCGCGAALQDFSAEPASHRVTVLQEKLVAGFNAAVLEASSSLALVNWLKDNGYVFSPEVEAWAKPYIDQGWKITALKVVNGKDTRDKKTSAAALRMSFKTDRPLFPYREPEYKGANETVGARSRLLRIYFLADARYDGKLANNTSWSGKTAWSGKLSVTARRSVLEHLKLPENTGPAEWYLTEFEDDWSYKPAPADVYFRPSASNAEVRRPPLIEYTSTQYPIDGALLALVAVAVVSPLLTRWKRRCR